MVSNVYAIYDKKAVCFGSPFLAVNHATAIRMVQAAMDDNSFLTKYPHDYRLDRVATFDDSTGIFSCVQEIVVEVSNLIPLPFDDGVLHDDREGETV